MKGVNLSEWAIRHRPLMLYFMVMGLLAGVGAYLSLGRSEDPAFTIKTMVVEARWPGATGDETLRQITERMEKKLQEIPFLDNLRSYTVPGRSTLFVTLRGDAPKSAVAELWYQVRKKIGDIRQTLPAGTQGPFFNDEFGDTFGIVYGFTADGFTHRELRDYVEDARSRLLRVKDVAKIEVIGAQDERIYIEFSTHRLAQLGLDRQTLLRALATQNAVNPAGVVETPDSRIEIEVSGKFSSEEDLRRINFAVGERMLRLADIARIRHGYADPPQPRFRVNGQDAIGLAISMQNGGDILALGPDVQAAIREITADLPIGIEPHLVANQPKVVHDAVDDFMEALWEAVGIVLGISFISLGLRAGAVVALSIPLVLAIVFVVMDAFGIDLQRVSLGALIISLGLLVDDAMITVESMVTKLERGWDVTRAATFAYTSTAFPMLTGTLVTMIGFIPIGFAKSSAGEYTFSLFAVVSIALFISWFVAVLFSPVIGAGLLRHAHPRRPEGGGRLLQSFRRLLLATMRRAKTTVAATVALFGLSILLVPLVPHQFFPSSDRPELIVDLKLAQDASVYASDRVSKRLDAMLAKDPDIDHWSAYVGRGTVRFYLPLDLQLENEFFAETVVVTRNAEARERVHRRLEAALTIDFPDVVARVFPLELGPPVGWPVQYRVSGPDPTHVREIANQVARTMGSSADLKKINFNWMEPIRKLRIEIDQDKARALGLTSQAVAEAVNMVVSGATATQLRDDIYLIDVVARAEDPERTSVETLRSLSIPLPNGRSAPLDELASIDYRQDLPLVWRRDRLPTLTVAADVRAGVMPAGAVDGLKAPMAALAKSLPPGYRIQLGGAVEESAKSQASVVAVFPIMLVLMITVLMIQLQKFSHLFLVISVAPLGLIGIVLALLALQQPMGFVALLGVVALIGMIVRNSVILVHQIDVELAAGRSRWDAVVEAAILRFRPIMLTAVAAILGMLPIAPTVFWGPMADAIMGGLLVATLLTLIFLPSLYVACLRIHEDEPPRPSQAS